MTKKISVEFEEVKVCLVELDLGKLEDYKSMFLALKNHERETSEILEVRGFLYSSWVHVTFLIDENKEESEEVQECRIFAGQFGRVGVAKVGTAWVINRRDTDIDSRLDYKDWFIYE